MRNVRRILGLFTVFFLAAGAMASEALETRCGWVENPTPANAWLRDKEGKWIIGVQGGYQAAGDMPEFNDGMWVITNVGEHGYGCACIRGQFDTRNKQVVRIVSGKVKPLKSCQNDKSVPAPECKKVEKIRKKLVCTDPGFEDLKAYYEHAE